MRPKHDSKSEGEIVEDVCSEMEYAVPESLPVRVRVDCGRFWGMYESTKAVPERAFAASMRGIGKCWARMKVDGTGHISFQLLLKYEDFVSVYRAYNGVP